MTDEETRFQFTLLGERTKHICFCFVILHIFLLSVTINTWRKLDKIAAKVEAVAGANKEASK